MEKDGYTILTGGNGFLGSNLLARLIADEWKVLVLKRTYSQMHRIQHFSSRFKYWNLDTCGVESIFNNYPVERIIHCATNYGINDAAPWETIEANLLLPLTLIQNAKKAGVKLFVNTDTILDKRISHYSLSKKQFLEWMDNYSNDMACINIAIEHFYGPNDNDSKFVARILKSLLEEQSEIALTLGYQRRDFVYIEDVVDGFMCILNAFLNSTTGRYDFEIGTGVSYSIREFLQIAQETTGNYSTQLKFGALPYRPNEIMNASVNIHALRGLGWSPKVTLRDGLRLTIARQSYKGGTCVT